MTSSTLARTALLGTLAVLLIALLPTAAPSLASAPGHSDASALGPANPSGDLGSALSAGAAAFPTYTNCGGGALYVCIGTSSGVGSLTPTTTFTPSSLGNSNRIFFDICDELDDNTANVTILDQNASRDAVASPAYTNMVPIGTAAGTGCLGTGDDSAQASSYAFYQIPSDLQLGGTWTFNVTTMAPPLAAGHWQQVTFHVNTYYVQLTRDQPYHLPGDSVTIYYQVLSYESEGPVSGALSFGATGVYVDNATTYATVALPAITPPAGGAQGSFTFTLPTNAIAGTDATVHLWANLSASGTPNTALSSITFFVDQMVAPALCAATTTNGGPTPCVLPLQFPAGSQLVLREVAWMGSVGGTEEQTIPGATFTFEILNTATGVPITQAGFPSPVSADASGTAREVLNTTGLNANEITLNASVTDPQNPHLSSHALLNITLTSPVPVAVQITLNASQYFGGDVIGGTYQLVSPGGDGSLPPFWTAYAYAIWFEAGGSTCPASPTGLLQQQGNLSGASGHLPSSYTTGLTMSGLLEVEVAAHNGSSTTSGGIASIACALVTPPQIAVNPSEVNYLPGDTISVTITPEGNALTHGGTTYFATVVGFATVTDTNPCTGTTMQVLYGRPLTGTSFSFAVPKQGASTCYEVSVSAQTSNGVVTGQDVALTEVSGYTLGVAVTTVSQYADGSYQPGETLSLSYTVSPIGNATVPSELTLYVYAGNLPYQRIQQATPSGSFSVTIPGGQGAGFFLIEVEASVPSPTSGTVTVTSISGVYVEPSPSALGYEIGAGSGFTLGELVIVIALAALVVVGVLWWRRNRWQNYRTHIHDEHKPPEAPMAAPAAGAGSAGGAPPTDDMAPSPFGGPNPAPAPEAEPMPMPPPPTPPPPPPPPSTGGSHPPW